MDDGKALFCLNLKSNSFRNIPMFLHTLLISFGTLQAQNLCSSFSTEPVVHVTKMSGAVHSQKIIKI